MLFTTGKGPIHGDKDLTEGNTDYVTQEDWPIHVYVHFNFDT